MNTEGVHLHFASNPFVIYTSINIRKIKFTPYIYIRFNQNPDEKSYVSVKIEAVNHLLSFSAICGTALMSNQIVESHGLF